MMLANSVFVQVSNNVVMEEAVWAPSGAWYTICGRLRLLFGAVGLPPRFSRVWEYASARGVGERGLVFARKKGVGVVVIDTF
jgi:hypothetical protein